ncbi:Uncharacterised protein [Mycobacteroides abscessus]|nr:Uncharacterised protein [Mycobacteroides abscessus]
MTGPSSSGPSCTGSQPSATSGSASSMRKNPELSMPARANTCSRTCSRYVVPVTDSSARPART